MPKVSATHRAGKAGCLVAPAVNEARTFQLYFAYEAADAAGIRFSLRPLIFDISGRETTASLGQILPRE
jgi:hypothetical protein